MRIHRNSKINSFFICIMMMAILLCCSDLAQAAISTEWLGHEGDYLYYHTREIDSTVGAGYSVKSSYTVLPSDPIQAGDEAEIVGYTGAGGVVTIPRTLGGVPVTSIHDGLFRSCSALTSISIPQGVTSIGESVFNGCTGLTSIRLNSATTTIYDSYEGADTIPAVATIIGYDPSTAKDYATKYNRVFEVIGTTDNLQSIAITTPATKLRYYTGDKLDITGLAIIGTYSDDSTKVLGITVANITGFNSAVEARDQVLTITVGAKTATYKVEIIPVPNAFTAMGVTTDRLYGNDRIGTAVNIADKFVSATTAILAPSSDANLVDALAAAPLAGKTSPILLTDNNTLADETKAELIRLKITKVYVVGAISQEVVNQVNAMPGVTAILLKGSDRIGTAAAINARLTSPVGSFVVGYDALADALSVTSYAAANNYSIIVANLDGSLPSAEAPGKYQCVRHWWTNPR